jgi:hypothetical protein
MNGREINRMLPTDVGACCGTTRFGNGDKSPARHGGRYRPNASWWGCQRAPSWQLDALGPVGAPLTDNYIQPACVGGSSRGGPVRYAIVDGMNVRDSRVHSIHPGGRQPPAKSCW